VTKGIVPPCRRLSTLDGLIVVTPEYNHGYTAVPKNALDHAYAEFARKPIGFVGGGVVSSRSAKRPFPPELPGQGAFAS
jgi:NAD(P)H-dependent FMN reductase